MTVCLLVYLHLARGKSKFSRQYQHMMGCWSRQSSSTKTSFGDVAHDTFRYKQSRLTIVTCGVAQVTNVALEGIRAKACIWCTGCHDAEDSSWHKHAAGESKLYTLNLG